MIPAIASREIEAQVRTLRRQGVKVEVIGEIVSDLNQRLFSRLFEMVAPAEFRTSGCLIVMGSEGRGEQTMRTDQDNGLILPGPVDHATLDTFRADFRGTGGLWLSTLPRQCDGAQSGMVKPPSNYLADFRRCDVARRRPHERGYLS
jgi:CBS domain-containing protein